MTEYEAFQSLVDSLEKAASACRELARTRPDQARIWEKMQEGIGFSREMAFKVAGEGTVGKFDS